VSGVPGTVPGVDASPSPSPVVPPSGVKSDGGRLWSSSSGWLLVFLLSFGVASGVRTFLLQQFSVSGTSMSPTLDGGERVLVDRLSYRFRDPAFGDVVVTPAPPQSGTSVALIKRVAGLPGELIEFDGCSVRRNGALVPTRGPGEVCAGGPVGSVVVPAGHVFLLGDNRDGSTDSRVFGTVRSDRLVGRAVVAIWPVSAAGVL